MAGTGWYNNNNNNNSNNNNNNNNNNKRTGKLAPKDYKTWYGWVEKMIH